jgi:hypothetical protein
MPVRHSDDEKDQEPAIIDEITVRESTLRDSLACLTRRQSQKEKDTNRKFSKIDQTQEQIMQTLLELKGLIGSGHSDPDGDIGCGVSIDSKPPTSSPTSATTNPCPTVQPQLGHKPGFQTGRTGPKPAQPATTHLRPAAHSQRRLDTLDFLPEDNPSRFRQWVNRLTQFQLHYQLSDVEAVAELAVAEDRKMMKRNAKLYNKGRYSVDFQIGQLVLVYRVPSESPNFNHTRKTRALSSYATGAWRVLQQLSQQL